MVVRLLLLLAKWLLHGYMANLYAFCKLLGKSAGSLRTFEHFVFVFVRICCLGNGRPTRILLLSHKCLLQTHSSAYYYFIFYTNSREEGPPFNPLVGILALFVQLPS